MNTGRVLILDDDPPVAQLIASVVSSCGLDSTITHTPAAFFASLEASEPDIIALDMLLPEMDGVEVMRRLAKQGCASKIIVISGLGGRVLDAAGRSAVEHGLDIIGVLNKPFSAVQLRAMIAEAESDTPALPLKQRQSDWSVTESSICEAVENEQFVLAYQPKVSCQSGEICGIEALVRWQHPTEGLIFPDQFIPQAESWGLMDMVTRAILISGLNWFQHAAVGEGSPLSGLPLSISFNLSAKNLRDIHFADHLQGLCQDFAIAPDRLILELTETSAMDDPMTSLDLVTRLRMKGFHLSLDDFGIGYSSMAQLVRLPFSEIKVDKSFVMAVGRSAEARTAVRSIIDLGHNLGLKATAEGVEDAETLNFLREVNCDLAQGYYISKPLFGQELLSWFTRYLTKN
ncbi:EAL domain-containing response regulator [Haliea sp. E1-2-M8]|uniref:EAL domain-containing response regulator n=1 Tax=Haliea sp. E1-2-M8 TaxID=3064706 RepID=UPI002718853E|nr:EAL domain-containing response regulator [Haliea sp. E1-2-M8]MDO8863682.1 EAL domain-containing response regulator [Haliea sp. E1-2-M8]